MSHIQIWSLSGFWSLLSLAHAAHSSYLMLANCWHGHILWEIAENFEQPHSRCRGLGFPFLAPPASVRIQTQLWPVSCRASSWPSRCRDPSFSLLTASLHLLTETHGVPKVWLCPRCQKRGACRYPAKRWLTLEGLHPFCSVALWDNPYRQSRVFQNSVPVLCAQTMHSQTLDYLTLPGWRGRDSVSTHSLLTSHGESDRFFLVFYSGFFLRSQ